MTTEDARSLRKFCWFMLAVNFLMATATTGTLQDLFLVLFGAYATLVIFHSKIIAKNYVIERLTKREREASRLIKDLFYRLRVNAEDANHLRHQLGYPKTPLPRVPDVDEVGNYLG